MRGVILSAAALLGACGDAPPHKSETPGDRAALEAAVAACDRGARRTDCDAARAELAHVRRADRMAAYRHAH